MLIKSTPYVSFGEGFCGRIILEKFCVKSLSIISCLSLFGLTACGIKTVDTEKAGLNLSIPPELLSNDVEKPAVARFTIATLCGHLVEKLPSSGLFKPLNIPAYPAGNAPTIVSHSDLNPDYYSLIDHGGEATLGAAYGPGTAKFSVQGDDRLETTVRPVSSCHAKYAGKATIAAALTELGIFGVDMNSIYIVNNASQEEIIVNHLKSISTNDQAAVTPIVNIGGSVYTKQNEVARKDFIAINAVKLITVIQTPPGNTVSSSPGSVNTANLSNTIRANEVTEPGSVGQLLSDIKSFSPMTAAQGVIGGEEYNIVRKSFLTDNTMLVEE